MVTVNLTQLESRVLQIVEMVRAGSAVEDDRVEIKREWPDPKGHGARQFAAACNALRGEDLLYIVGLGEDGVVYELGATDPSSWWPQMQKRFSEVQPELRLHVVVPVDDATSVVGMLFGTTQAPYVVKGEGDQADRLEVPLRTSSGTRSARRSELLRMLSPAIRSPDITTISASLLVDWVPPRTFADRRGEPEDVPEHYRLTGSMFLWVNHIDSAPLTLPTHEMAISIELGSFTGTARMSPMLPIENARQPSGAKRAAVEVLDYAVAVAGPGGVELTFQLIAEHLTEEEWRTFGTTGNPRLTAVLGIATMSEPLVLLAELAPGSVNRPSEESQFEVGYWRYNAPARFASP